MTVLVVVAVAVVLALAAAAWVSARNRRADGVDSFRRQIDALSPEARRSTVDQLKEQAQKDDDDDDEPEGGVRGA